MTSGNLKEQGVGWLAPVAPVSSVTERWIVRVREHAQNLAARLDLWNRRRRTWIALQGMDDRALGDIGLTRADMWEDPRARLRDL